MCAVVPFVNLAPAVASHRHRARVRVVTSVTPLSGPAVRRPSATAPAPITVPSVSRNLRDFTRAVYGFDAVVRRAPSAAWTAPSACEGWTGRDVLDHFRDVASGVAALAGGGRVAAPARVDDPPADWIGVRNSLLEALDTPGCLQREGDTPFGHMTVDRFVGILGVDPLCHTFDLAVAAGVDPALDPGLVERYHRNLQKAGDAIRVPGMFGPALEPPADATPAERFLALAGRDPRP